MATVGTPKLRSITSSHHKPQNLYTILPHRLSLSSTSSSLPSVQTLKLSSPLLPHSLHRRFTVRAGLSVNGAAQRRFDFDLFVIGAGSCGFSASQLATSYGASVAVCELPSDNMSSDAAGGVGGTCVPKKLLLYGSKFSHEYKGSHGFGWSFEDKPKNNRITLIANKNSEIQRLTGVYKNMLKNAGAVLIEGRGKIIDAHTVDVDGKLYSARNILISVGGRPLIPDIPGKEYAIDSDAALSLSEKPKKLAVIGGGYEAVEIAGIFKGLTSSIVEVFLPENKILRGFDEEVGEFLGEQMSLRDIEFHTEESPQAILKSPDGTLSLKTNKGTIDGFEQIMFATNRKPNTENLGLEQVGVKMNKNGAIEVDEYSRTSVPSIWAVGDVTDRMNLTPAALMDGMALAKTLFTNEPSKPDYRAAPSGVFTQPPIGQVGLTEEQATEKYGDIDVYTANFRPLKATLSGQPDRVLMKMILCAKTDKVIGLHMCGEDAPEIIQGFAVAVKAGLTKADFDATIGIHPTAAEEFVTLRTPTRKNRFRPEAKKVAEVVMMKATAGVGA